MKWFLGILLAIILAFLIGFSFYQYTQINLLHDSLTELKSQIDLPSHHISNPTNTTNIANNGVENCLEDCKKQIQIQIETAISKITITPVPTTVQKQTITTNSTTKQTTYVSLGSGSTVNSDWETLEDSAVVLDLASDYNANATISWEASLKILNGNGSAYARLYDSTHNIAVDGSEFQVDESSTFVQRTSKNLPFWKGRNTYKVQIKSLNGYEVTVSGGRLKIQY
jgi:hypothetical protein